MLSKFLLSCVLAVAFVGMALAAPLPCAPLGNGECYYVATDGDDTNDGLSPETAFATITHADRLLEQMSADARAGSVIYVMPGLYHEEAVAGSMRGVLLRADGLPGLPITITSHDPENPAILDGGLDPVTRMGGHDVIRLDYAEYRVIANLILRNGVNGIEGAWGHSIIENNTIHDIYLDHGRNPNGIGYVYEFSQDNIIRYNHIYNVGDDEGGRTQNTACIMMMEGNDVLVHNNYMHNCGSGIRYKHHQLLGDGDTDFAGSIYRNIVDDAGWGIGVGGSNLLVYENLIIDASPGIQIGGADAAVVNDGFRDNQLLRNTVHTSSSSAYYMWADSDPSNWNYDAIVHDNLFSGSGRMQDIRNWQTLADSDHNCYASDSFLTPDGDSISTLHAQGYDTNSIITTDTVADTVNYVLTATSPCRNAGSSGQHIGARTGDNHPIGIPHELCNGLDDTRDGVIDEGCGSITPPPPPPVDTTPPVRSNGAPSGVLSTGTTSTTLSLTTNEAASCRYSTTPGQTYAQMAGVFSGAGTTSHTTIVTVQAGQSYTYTVRCQDGSGNTNTNDHTISFSVDASPPPPQQAAECAAPAAEWLFCDDFEQDRISTYFEYDDDEGEFARTAGVGLNGSTAMRARFQQGEVGAGSIKLAFGRTPTSYFDPVPGTENNDYREVYWRMYVRNEDGWTGGGGSKLSRVTVFAGSDWSQAMIGHVWSTGSNDQFLAIDPASGTDAAGNLITSGYNDFDTLRWLGLRASSTPLFDSAHVGDWYCIEAHVRLNDAGQSNGEFTLWIDDQLEAQRTDLNWAGNYTAYGMNALMFENYWNDGSTQEQERYFDNIVVSTQRIGCGGVSEPLEGDVNGDGTVNLSDLIIVVTNISRQDIDDRADRNSDGSVDIYDLVLVARNFGNSR